MAKRSEVASSAHEKMLVREMPDDRKREAVAQLTDDVLAKLTSAFFEVISNEKWGKRDLALISGLNETAIGHILAGRRKNLTVETIALLARAMQKRPELYLHDIRPKGNRMALPTSAAAALEGFPLQAGNTVPTVTASTSAAAASPEMPSRQPSPVRSLETLEVEQAELIQRLER
jgi:hypothetical protein